MSTGDRINARIIGRRNVTSRRMATIAVGGLLYCALALAFFLQSPVIARIGELLPDPLRAIVLTAAGPAALLDAGINAWPVVVLALALIAICLRLARLTLRKSPETEWFAFWLLCALLVWAGSPWLLLVFGI
jgi:hypothetical protein